MSVTVHEKQFRKCKRWYVYWRHKGKKGTCSKSFKTPEEAEKFADSMRTPIEPEKCKGWGYI